MRYKRAVNALALELSPVVTACPQAAVAAIKAGKKKPSQIRKAASTATKKATKAASKKDSRLGVFTGEEIEEIVAKSVKEAKKVAKDEL